MLNRLLDYFAEMGEDLPSFEAMTEDYLRSVHLAIFYLAGRYYNLSKRFVGIRFVSRVASILSRLRLIAGADLDTIQEISSFSVGCFESRPVVVRSPGSADDRPTPRSNTSHSLPPSGRPTRRRNIIDGKRRSEASHRIRETEEEKIPRRRQGIIKLGLRP